MPFCFHKASDAGALNFFSENATSPVFFVL
jgi:hypothetical protein